MFEIQRNLGFVLSYKDSNLLLQVQRVKQEAEETERALRERIQRLEMSRLQLEEEISQMKTSNMTEKLQAEESINIAKQKVKSEEVPVWNFLKAQ